MMIERLTKGDAMMKAYDYAELYLNTGGNKGERELREYIAAGGDIAERDRDGLSALDIANATSMQDKAMRAVAPELVAILKSLGA